MQWSFVRGKKLAYKLSADAGYGRRAHRRLLTGWNSVRPHERTGYVLRTETRSSFANGKTMLWLVSSMVWVTARSRSERLKLRDTI